MNKPDTLVVISAGGAPGRCRETARGRTVLERVVCLARSLPETAEVAVLAPDTGQAMSLGRAFKDLCNARFHAMLGGRLVPTYRWLLQKYPARFLLCLDGDNLLVTRDVARGVLDACRKHSAPAFFDATAEPGAPPSVFGRVDAAPADAVIKAAAFPEYADS